jgi:V/A-type H+-transporting ATPase subunit A
VELGPGLIENIYDGIQRPLEKIVARSDPITRGVEVPALDRDKKWDFTRQQQLATQVVGGDILGTVPETPVVLHKIMVPSGKSGTIVKIAEAGSYTVDETVAVLKQADGTELP